MSRQNEDIYPMLVGQPVTIRPIRITDADADAQLYRRLMPRPRYYRFVGGLDTLSPSDFKSSIDVDYHHSVAFLAAIWSDGEVTEIGVGRVGPASAAHVNDMLVVVAEAWRDQGVEELLASQLVRYAEDRGIQRLYCVDRASNDAMRVLARDIGMSCMTDPSDPDQVIYTLDLAGN